MKELKNNVYELEGLLELADKRPEKFASLKPLIDRRIEEIMALWRNLPDEIPSEEDLSEYEPDDEPLYLRAEENEPYEYEQAVTEEITATPDPVRLSENEDYSGYTESSGLKAGKKQAVESPSEKRIALCLNDRFRFTRVLGMGDKVEFERRLSRLANAGDFETARDYIVDECCLDPDDADVADLIEIVRTYYESV